MTTPGATEAVTPEQRADELLQNICIISAFEGVRKLNDIGPMVATSERYKTAGELRKEIIEALREAEANALRRAAEAQCDGCRLSGAPDRYGKHAEPTPIKCQALSIRSLLPKEEGKAPDAPR